MGHQIYLTNRELRILNNALDKWRNWASEDLEDWEFDAYGGLVYKLREER